LTSKLFQCYKSKNQSLGQDESNKEGRIFA
jgi:hypothetical protein